MVRAKFMHLSILSGVARCLQQTIGMRAVVLGLIAGLALPVYAQAVSPTQPQTPTPQVDAVPSAQAHLLIDQLIAQQEARQAAQAEAETTPAATDSTPVMVESNVAEPTQVRPVTVVAEPVATPKVEPVSSPQVAVAATPITQPKPQPAPATVTVAAAPTPAPKLTPKPAATPIPVAKRAPVRDSIVRVAVPARRPFARGYSSSTNQQAKMLADMLHSRVAFVMDQTTGKTILNKNGRESVPIASITKLMTAVITLDANLPMGEMMTISEADIDTIKRSRSRLEVGTTLPRQKMLHLSLMSSENRAANALGRYYPGGLPAAIRAMNQRAVMLGMRDTRYVEPTGLSSRNQSSARDLALLVRAAYRYPLIRNYTTYPLEHFDVNGKMLRYNNTNRLVHSIDWDIGLQKTGFISEAGRCVVMQSTIAGRNIIIVLLDSPNNNRRAEDADAIRYFVQNEVSPSWANSGRVAGVY